MKTDPILDELRHMRDAHAKEFNYDLKAIAADHNLYAAKLKKEGWIFVRPKTSRPRAKKKAA
jgi:hypothetical protein